MNVTKTFLALCILAGASMYAAAPDDKCGCNKPKPAAQQKPVAPARPVAKAAPCAPAMPSCAQPAPKAAAPCAPAMSSCAQQKPCK